MKGFPKILQTKEDYYNVVQLAKRGDISREDAARTLDNLSLTRESFYLREVSAGKPPEEQTQDDYEKRVDPNSQMERLMFTAEEINKLKEGL